MSRWFWSLLLISVTAVWGWTFTFMKVPATEFGSIPFLAVRFTLAALLMLPAVLRPAGKPALRDGWLVGVILASAYVFQTYGLIHTSATNCGLITGLFVLFAPLWSFVLFRIPIPRVIGLAAVLSLIGLYLLTGTGVEPLKWGDFAVLVAAAAYGLHIALLDRVAKRNDAAALAGVQFLMAAIVLVVLWPIIAPPLRWPPTSAWPAILVTSILATVFGFYVQTAVQQHLAASRVAVILTMESAFAALFGVMLGGDRLDISQWIGAGIVFFAVLLAEFVPKFATEKASVPSNHTLP